MVIKERKTKVTSIAINEYLIEKAKKLVDTGKFSSVSDVITTALTEFLYKTQVERENIDIIALLFKLQQNSECRIEMEKILSIIENNNVMKNNISKKEPSETFQNRNIEAEESKNKKVIKRTNNVNEQPFSF